MMQTNRVPRKLLGVLGIAVAAGVLTGCSYLDKHDNAYMSQSKSIPSMHFGKAVQGEVRSALYVPPVPKDAPSKPPSLFPPGND